VDLSNKEEQMALSNARMLEVEKSIDLYQHRIDTLQSNLDEERLRALFLKSSDLQGKLFRRLLEFSDEGTEREFDMLACSGMYLADRHSTIYELVNRIFIKDATISNTYFANACFDNVTFKGMVFIRDCFYHAFFEDVRFINCKFVDCDFTSSRGINLTFEGCTPDGSTNLSLIEYIK
jgi:uncharacterized protein YjbI with pentapeptide repeats